MDKVFFAKLHELFLEFGLGKKMVLSTCVNHQVSSRMMSLVLIDGKFYFQTDLNLRKYQQLKSNPNVALCIDNLQIEGICEEIGHPLDNTAFCKAYSQCYKHAFDSYTSLKNERLFSVTPTYIERWVYKEKIPYLEFFKIDKKEYQSIRYEGE